MPRPSAGVFSPSIGADVAPDRLRRFSTKHDSCLVLIDMDAVLQNKPLSVFHHALNPNGCVLTFACDAPHGRGLLLSAAGRVKADRSTGPS